MKVTCKAINLIRSVNYVSHVAGRGGALPILSNVLIRAEANSIVLSATNLELAVQAIIRGKIEQEGAITVNARVLSDYVSLLPADATVQIELIGDTVSISAESTQTTLQALPASDYPLIPTINGSSVIKVGGETLRRGLNQVLFAVSTDETRPEINGVFVNIQDEKLTLASTDSYRLAECIIVTTGSTITTSRIIPWRTLQEVVRCVGSDEVIIKFSDSQVLFESGDVTIISRLIEGQYPNYQPIIPTSHIASCVVESATIIRLIKQASLFCKPGVNDVRVLLENNKITINSSNATIGEHHGSADIKTEGQSCSSLFNYRYLLEGVAAINAASVTLSLTGETTPALLHAEEQSNYRYVVMPIQP